jgi:hypothetical protein
MLEARFPQNLCVITLGDARLSPSYAGADINDNVGSVSLPM